MTLAITFAHNFFPSVCPLLFFFFTLSCWIMFSNHNLPCYEYTKGHLTCLGSMCQRSPGMFYPSNHNMDPQNMSRNIPLPPKKENKVGQRAYWGKKICNSTLVLTVLTIMGRSNVRALWSYFIFKFSRKFLTHEMFPMFLTFDCLWIFKCLVTAPQWKVFSVNSKKRSSILVGFPLDIFSCSFHLVPHFLGIFTGCNCCCVNPDFLWTSHHISSCNFSLFSDFGEYHSSSRLAISTHVRQTNNY
jgi:hypothetical protein